MNDDRAAIVAVANQLRARYGLAIDADGIEALVDYVDLLIRSNKKTNLVGTEDPARLLDEMVFDSLQVTALLGESFEFVDIGSGGGLPGLPLALVRPAARGTLVEPRAKRAAFLRLACAELGADNVRIVEGELEAAPMAAFDVALAKAVFAPAEWVARASVLLRPGGRIVVYANGTEPEAIGLLEPAQRARVVAARSYLVASAKPRTVLLLADA